MKKTAFIVEWFIKNESRNSQHLIIAFFSWIVYEFCVFLKHVDAAINSKMLPWEHSKLSSNYGRTSQIVLPLQMPSGIVSWFDKIINHQIYFPCLWIWTDE